MLIWLLVAFCVTAAFFLGWMLRDVSADDGEHLDERPRSSDRLTGQARTEAQNNPASADIARGW